MVLDSDFYRIQSIKSGTVDYGCKAHGFDWPPPMHLVVNGEHFTLQRCSALTDEQVGSMPMIARGALYIPSEAVTFPETLTAMGYTEEGLEKDNPYNQWSH